MSTNTLFSGNRSFITALANAKTMRSERDLVTAELEQNRLELGKRDLTSKEVTELLVRSMHYYLIWKLDISFCYVAAINLTQNAATIYEKRIGYLAVCLFLKSSDELLLLLVNGMRKDLQSDSPLENIMALTAVASLASKDMLLALLPPVVTCLLHANELVRRKAVLAIARLYSIEPKTVMDSFSHIQKSLADSDPAVMCATLVLFTQIAKKDPLRCKPLTSAFLHILIQLLEGRLPNGFDYHGLSGMWAIIQCLQVLRYLAEGDLETSAKIRPMLLDLIKLHYTGDDTSFGIMLACFETLAKLVQGPDPSPAEKKLVCTIMNRYLKTSQNTNLMYLGIKVLRIIQSSHPDVAPDFQNEIMACLDHSDDLISSSTLDLVYDITTTASSSETLKLILKSIYSAPPYRQLDLVLKAINLIIFESPIYGIKTLIYMYQIVDDKIVRPSLTEPITELLDGDSDGFIQKIAVDTCYRAILDKSNRIGELLIWIIGEYFDASNLGTQELTRALLPFLRENEDHELVLEALKSMSKIVKRTRELTPDIIDAISILRRSKIRGIQRRVVEFFENIRVRSTISDLRNENFGSEFFGYPDYPSIPRSIRAQLPQPTINSVEMSPPSPSVSVSPESVSRIRKVPFGLSIGKSAPTTSITTISEKRSPIIPKNIKLAQALFGPLKKKSTPRSKSAISSSIGILVGSESEQEDVGADGYNPDEMEVPLIPLQGSPTHNKPKK